MSRQSYPDKLRAQIRHWQERMDELRTQLGQAGTDSRRQFDEQLRDLQAKQQAAKRKLDQLDRTGRSVRRKSRAFLGTARTRVNRVVRRLVSGDR